VDGAGLSHNLIGQRLGRKGRDSRNRILAAAERLLAEQPDVGLSLSAVAREASLAMTTLYLYFADLTELLLAVLEPIMASAEDSYVGHLRHHWPDDALAARCLDFVEAYYEFWVRHSRILHLRNSYAGGGDERMREHHRSVSLPVMELLVRQMESNATNLDSPAHSMAAVLLTAIERLITVATDPRFPSLTTTDPNDYIRALLSAEARLLELGIRDQRAVSSGPMRHLS
jgi:AcrR family transcriptional regulator